MDEIDNLLRLLDIHLPLCKDEWEYMLSENNESFPKCNRTVGALRCKFASLQRKKIPTGDPLKPPDVRWAKHIRHKMTEKAEIGVNDEAEEKEFFSVEEINQDQVNVLDVDPSSEIQDEIDGSHRRTDGTLSIDDNEPSSEVPNQSPVPSPRPLVRCCLAVTRSNKTDTADLMEILKAQIVQDGLRREEERRKREQDRQLFKEKQEADEKIHE